MTEDIQSCYQKLLRTMEDKIAELAALEEELHIKEADLQRRERAIIRSGRSLEGEREYGALLGLRGKVSVPEIKQAYRKLAAALHPDKHTGSEPIIRTIAEEHLKQVNDAYSYFRKKYKI